MLGIILATEETTVAHNVSAIDVLNANPARGHKEERRSTGHIMVTTRYSNQQGSIMMTTRYSNQQESKSRQNSCQVQPPTIVNLSASRRCLWVRTTVFTVWVAANISESEYREDCLVCCSSTKVIKVIQKVFLAIGDVHEDRLCDTLQAMAPTNVKTIHQTPFLFIESNLDRLGLLSPTPGQRSQQQRGQITPQSVLINKPKFLRVTSHAETGKIAIPRSMVVESLSW